MTNGAGPARIPKILIPFTPPGEGDPGRDFFIFLRPETNGVAVESILMKVITGNSHYKENLTFCYLANFPGEYIIHHKLVEQHYHLKISFAHRGARLFTPYMNTVFQAYFREPADPNRVIGSFQAMEKFKISAKELFHLWVPDDEMLVLNGQSIKKYRDHYIVNYDIPAILHKNSYKSDIAVMVFRSRLSGEGFKGVIKDMGRALIAAEVINPHLPISHVFHYSKGPLEFLLDAQGYLLDPQGTHHPLGELGFARFLHDREIPVKTVQRLLKFPILLYRGRGSTLVERDIFDYTIGNGFEDAYRKLHRALGQYCIS